MFPVIRCAALLRVSTTSVEQEESPQHQLAYIREEIRRHSTGDEIWTDTGRLYEDELTGALVLERPGIQRLLADAAAGVVDAVVLKSISRLGRDTLGVLTLKRRLDDLGVDLVSLQDGYRASRDMELIFLIHADRAQHGRQEISRSVRTGMRQKALKGGWTPGMVPFGYVRLDRNRIAPHDATAEIVREIFRLRADGWGITAICDRLNNELRAPAPAWWLRWELRRERLEQLAATDDRWAARLQILRRRYEGGRVFWAVGTVHQLLRNPAYMGSASYYRTYYRRLTGGRKLRERRPESEHITVPVPPLVDVETWERCRDIGIRGLAARGVPRLGAFPLRGLLRCGQCGSRMQGVVIQQVRARYYVCQRKRNSHACDAPAVPADALETQVLEHLRPILRRLAEEAPQQQPAEGRRSRPGDDPVRKLEVALDRLKAKRNYYHDQHFGGRVTDAELDEALAELRRQEDAAQRELTRLRGAVKSGSRNERALRELVRQYGVLSADDPSALREMLVAAVGHITLQFAPRLRRPNECTLGRPSNLPPDKILHTMLRDPQGKNQVVAELLGCSWHVIRYRRLKAGIPPHPHGSGNRRAKQCFFERWQPVVDAWRSGQTPAKALGLLAAAPGTLPPGYSLEITLNLPNP